MSKSKFISRSASSILQGQKFLVDNKSLEYSKPIMEEYMDYCSTIQASKSVTKDPKSPRPPSKPNTPKTPPRPERKYGNDRPYRPGGGNGPIIPPKKK